MPRRAFKPRTFGSDKERSLISAHTKAALARAKVRSVKLGNPHAAEALGKAHERTQAAADKFAASILPMTPGLVASLSPLSRLRT